MDLTSIIYQIANLFIGVLVIGVLVLGWAFIMRYRNAKAVEGKILVHFWTWGGRHYHALCREDKGKVEAPKGHDIGDYLIQPSCKFQDYYPYGAPKIVQVGVQATSYMENVLEPNVSVKPEEWITSPEKHEITSFLMRIASNESFAKTAQLANSAVWKDVSQMTQFIKNVPLMFYISIGIFGGLLIVGYLVYMVYSQQASLINYLKMYTGG